MQDGEKERIIEDVEARRVLAMARMDVDTSENVSRMELVERYGLTIETVPEVVLPVSPDEV
ncbi:hypothetical protein BH23PAT1_BH23PAT1_5470 [soil metagenome]